MAAPNNNRSRGFSPQMRLAVGTAAVGVWWGLQHLPIRNNGSIGGVGDICLFRIITHLPCPFCGMTRSLLCFFQGNWQDALRWHPLGVLLGSVITVALLIWILSGFNVWSSATQLGPKATRLSGLVIIAAVGGTWLLRLAGIWPLPPSP